MINIQPLDTRLRFLADRIESQIARNYTDRCDRNGNGVIDRSEFRGSAEKFERMDRDGNGRLEVSELKRSIDLLKQREPVADSRASEEAQPYPDEPPSFGVSPHGELTEGIRNHFAEEIGELDTNGNGFLDRDEFDGMSETFAAMDQDGNSLVTPREWAEGFMETHTEIEMAIRAYRYGNGIFGNRGGMIHMSV